MTKFTVDIGDAFYNGSNILLHFIAFFSDEKPSEFLHVVEKFVPAFVNLSIDILLLNSIRYLLFGWVGAITRRGKCYENAYKTNRVPE